MLIGVDQRWPTLPNADNNFLDMEVALALQPMRNQPCVKYNSINGQLRWTWCNANDQKCCFIVSVDTKQQCWQNLRLPTLFCYSLSFLTRTPPPCGSASSTETSKQPTSWRFQIKYQHWRWLICHLSFFGMSQDNMVKGVLQVPDVANKMCLQLPCNYLLMFWLSRNNVINVAISNNVSLF